MSWVTIAIYHNPLHAHIARSQLEAAGFEVFLADEHMVSTNWLASFALGGVKLRVRPDEEERAKALLDRTPETVPEGVDGDRETECTGTAESESSEADSQDGAITGCGGPHDSES